MKRILISLALALGILGSAGVASALQDFSGGVCTGARPASAAYKAKYCPIYGPGGTYDQIYGKGGLYCIKYGYNC